MTSTTATYLVQIASVPGHQVGQRAFEQSRYLHDLLINTLINDDNHESNKQQIKALTKLIPDHEIVLRSGFSQTAQWGLEPNMFVEIHGNEKQARIISALFGHAFCQDGIGIGGEVEGQNHSVLIINNDWKNEKERVNLVSIILQKYPNLSAQLDINGQLAFHDYSMSSSSSAFTDIISLIKSLNDNCSIEEKQMKSELVDRTEYDNLLMLLESSNARRALNILKHAHARFFSGYACGSLTLPTFSLRRRRQNRREQNRDKLDKYNRHSISPPHLCSLILTARRPYGENANHQCSAAPDLPLLMAIGGIFALFFLGIAYRFLKMLTSVNNQQSAKNGIMRKLLVGFVSFIFGVITFIFFILIQIRVYQAYSNNIQYDTQSTSNFCYSTIMRGALILIVLTYISIFLFTGIFILAFINAHRKRQEKCDKQFEMKTVPENTRF
ncbi:unnamed protein product [Adineta steineri]|uniref:Uncharacterized protein n=1 Tax=Adineta steineri TaxID=433720 RepID=A0A818LEN7_9BILA|nr:unnamed protein product [Adineta steineri]CAF3574632.1 unnamed protein product [Adineta steineri]